MRNIDKQYVAERERENDFLWQQHERKLYYSYKNENYISFTIISCIISFILTNSLFFDIIIVAIYIIVCKINNILLDEDEYILNQREIIRKGREQLK